MTDSALDLTYVRTFPSFPTRRSRLAARSDNWSPLRSLRADPQLQDQELKSPPTMRVQWGSADRTDRSRSPRKAEKFASVSFREM